MGRLFGTDGIRGRVNQYPINVETALEIGRAVAFYCKDRSPEPKIVIGKDTRVSGDMLEQAIAAGICSVSSDVLLAGVIPTPAVACLTSSLKADAGIVISASHNPYYDNGIKIFNHEGFKLADEIENDIESLILSAKGASLCKGLEKTGRVKLIDNADQLYLDFLKLSLPENFSLKGKKIILDCSNGAAFKIAPKLFSELGADVRVLFDAPDGFNINQNCGSQQTEILREKTVESKADIGLAFDGDADRLICIDEKGNEITGDRILLICAKYLLQNDRLKNNLVVTTVMSNIGLKIALEKMGVDHAAADVGDRYVLEMMREKKASLGGEDSGHIIFLDHHTTGDGLLAALKLLEAQEASDKTISELAKMMTVYPQVLINVPVKEKPKIESLTPVVREIRAAEEQLRGRGRVLVRYSGTQLKCRVMVEGPTMEETTILCQNITNAVKRAIGI